VTGLIKSGSGSGLEAVRAFPFSNAIAVLKPASKDDEERERLQRTVGALEGELRQRDGAIVELRAEIEAAFERGQALGREAGLTEAENRELERLSILEFGVRDAQAELSNSLSSLERLAAVLARDCLEMILGVADYRHEQLTTIIANQVGKIEKAALLNIAVSFEDFPDKQSLAVIAERVGIDSAVIAASSDVSPGCCTMRLLLGNREVGVRQQWGVLRERLAELALPGASE
jgi:hypothetical protein